jgi:dihydroflavonol-4-reductase
MRIAVTGASGHIGSNLIRMLIDRGHQVRVLFYKDNRGFRDLPLEHIRGSLENTESLRELVSGTDVVFHLAAQISIEGKNDRTLLEKNIEGTRNLVQIIRDTGDMRLIHFSSIHAVEHEPLDLPLDENRPLAFEDPIFYTRSKAYSEQVVQDAVAEGLDAVILNPTAVIGPFDHKPSLLGQAIIRFYCGKLPAMIPGGYDWVDVRDIARASITAIEKGRKGQRYILSGHWETIEKLGSIVEANGGHKLPALKVPFWLAKAGVPVFRLLASVLNRVPLYTSESLHIIQTGNPVIDNSLARKELNFQPRPFEETVKDSVDWFRKNNYMQTNT